MEGVYETFVSILYVRETVIDFLGPVIHTFEILGRLKTCSSAVVDIILVHFFIGLYVYDAVTVYFEQPFT